MFQEKIVPFLQAKAEGDAAGPGQVSGYGSVFGGVDSYADTIVPGAYAETLPEFLKDGFIAHGHDWQDYVATVKSAHEDSTGLFIVGEYHTDPESQKVRTRVAERLARGQSMGLSIGYDALAWEMRQVDEPVRNQWGEFTNKVRALTKIKLYEVSLVTVPADPAARVTDAKGLHLAYESHSEHVRVAVREWLERSKAGLATRRNDKREPSKARRQGLAAMQEALATAIAEIDVLLKETEPPQRVDVQRLRFDLDRTLARVHRAYGVTA